VSNLSRLLNLGDLSQYKIHAARYNQNSHPLDVFLSDRKEWANWTAWFNGKHDFNRPYVISFVDFYPERDAWLFAGIYRIKNYASRPDSSLAGTHAYDVELLEQGADLIGRLKLHLPLSQVRNVRLKAENYVSKMELIEVLRKPYTGPGFSGYDRSSLTWSELLSITQNKRQDWKTALAHMKGVYVITFSDGRNYVGSAYGEVGIWSRWNAYALSRHGDNAEMQELDAQTKGKFIEGARFTIIEAWPTRTEDSLIIKRENYWKEALMSRKTGINRN